jgi:hypothetical protein
MLDRKSFDTGPSQQVQGDLAGIIARLESAIAGRQADVNAAMADFSADGVSEDYRAVETRWNNAATEVRQIIEMLKQTMVRNDETAGSTLSRARSAVQSIG